jgi:SagB-type dehydrogenase family enzyme
MYVLPFNISDLKPASYHHNPFADALEEIGPAPTKAELEKCVFATGLWTNAAMLIVITGVFERSASKYGDRAYCYIQQEAGHLMQNILLACEEYALPAVSLGGFYEETLGAMLQLDPAKESPVYIALVGA